jgi:hypothetical protein
VRSPSTQAAGAATLSLSLGTAAAAGLHAPDWVWIATGIAAGVCLAVAVGLYLAPRRKDGAPPAGIKAGHGIRAGGNIEADAGIEAGQGIEAGGDIQAGALNRVDLFPEPQRGMRRR